MKLKGKEILVIDDDEQYQYFINNILANLGIVITQADNFDDAVKKISESVPHLIITDIKLNNEKTGIDFQKFIKNDSRFMNIPLFVITADASKNTIFQSLALGAQEYIIKPVLAKELVQKVRRVFLDYKSPEINFLDEKGHYKDKYSKTFKNDFAIELNTDINLRAINELSCILQGPVKFPKSTIVDVTSELLIDNDADHLGFRSIENSRILEAGVFSTRFSFIGIEEKTAQKLRQLRVTKK